MKKMLLFMIFMACISCFSETRQERINRRLAEMQETDEYKVEKNNLINSEEVKKISRYKYVSKNIFEPNKSFTSYMCIFVDTYKQDVNLFVSYNSFDNGWSFNNRK